MGNITRYFFVILVLTFKCHIQSESDFIPERALLSGLVVPSKTLINFTHLWFLLRTWTEKCFHVFMSIFGT